MFRAMLRPFPGLLAVLLLGGCGWLNRPPGDPARDPNYLSGKECLVAGAHDAARAHFQRAVDVNPANQLAHFELGLLYYNQIKDPVLAIYHFERYQTLARLQKGSGGEDSGVAEWIKGARYALAEQAAEAIGRTQQDLRLSECSHKVTELNAQIERLRQELASARQQLLTAQQSVGRPEPEPAAARQPRPPATNPQPVAQPVAQSNRPAPAATHTIAPGETPYAIARRHGIPLNALLEANPGIDPRRLRVGDTLRLPPR